MRQRGCHFFGFLLVLSALVPACSQSSSSGSSGTALNFTGAAVESLPQVSGSRRKQKNSTRDGIADVELLAGFFEQECFMPNSDNYCPTGVNTSQTDIFQVYVTLDGTTPKFLAFNFAGANTMFSRSVLLVNLVNNRFAVKYLEPISGNDSSLVATGVGGVNRTTGVANTGYYYVRYSTSGSGTGTTKCVDNSTALFENDTTNCSTSSVPMGWTSSTTLSDYLGMTATEISRLSTFLDFMAQDALLWNTTTSLYAPEDTTDDPELFFPQTIQ